jgi:hypothetical protein
MKTIAPSTPTVVQANHVKAGRIASSSKIAIASINFANWLNIYKQNLQFLSLNEAPLSTLDDSSTATGVFLQMRRTTATNELDVFMVGKRQSTGGSFAIGNDAATAPYQNNAGSEDEGLSIVRVDNKRNPPLATQSALFLDSFSPYMFCVMSLPNYYNASTAGETVAARSAGQPIVSAFEDDAIAEATDGGSVSDVVDSIKRAWTQSVRGIFSVHVAFTTDTSTNTSLVDTISGTSGYKISARGRQLYTDDTTATVYFMADADDMTFVLSTSKQSFSTAISGIPHGSNKSLLIDCLADDEINISFRATNPGVNTGYFYSAMIVEYDSEPS